MDLLCFCAVLCLLSLCARLFICALWSLAGEGQTSWLSLVVSNCEFVTFPLVFWVRFCTSPISAWCLRKHKQLVLGAVQSLENEAITQCVHLNCTHGPKEARRSSSQTFGHPQEFQAY